MFPEIAVASRKRVLANTVKANWVVGAAHLPYPGIGRVREDSDGYAWVAATLAGVLAIAPANATFPLATFGLSVGFTLFALTVGGIVAAGSTYWLFGKGLSSARHEPRCTEVEMITRPSILTLINTAGREAIQSIQGIISMLWLSLVFIIGLQTAGFIGWLPAAFEHFNEVHPHSSLKMHSPREFRRQQAALADQALYYE